MPSPPARHRGNLASLDVLRGLAALYVAAYHSVGALTPSGLSFDTRGGSMRLLRQGNPLGLLGFGLYAVLAFFILSGFVIHLRQAQHPDEPAQRGKLRWTADYGWRRLLRIFPPLLAALVLTAVLAAAGSRLFPGWPWPDGNLTDARNVLVPAYGASAFSNNTPLWSVAYEIWFYLAYVPIVLVVLAHVRLPPRIRMGLVLAASLVVAWVLVLVQDHAPQLIPAPVQGLTSIFVYLPAWLAGAFLAELYAAGVKLPGRLWMAAPAAVLLAVATFSSGNDLRPAVDLLWGLAICLLIAALTLGPDMDWLTTRPGRWAASTSSWSYSLYLVHLPVILFGQAALGYDGALRITNPLAVLAIFLAALGVGWLFSHAIERPTVRLVSRSASGSTPGRSGRSEATTEALRG